MSCTPQTFLWTVYLLGFLLLIYPSILSRLRYPTLLQLALLLRCPIQPSATNIWQATSFFFLACSLLYIAIFKFFTSLRVFVSSGYIPSSFFLSYRSKGDKEDLGPHACTIIRNSSYSFHARVHGDLSVSIRLDFPYECGSAWGGRQQIDTLHMSNPAISRPVSSWWRTLTSLDSSLTSSLWQTVHVSPYPLGFGPLLESVLNTVLYSSYLSILRSAFTFFSCCHLYCFQLLYQLRVPFPYFSCIV